MRTKLLFAVEHEKYHVRFAIAVPYFWEVHGKYRLGDPGIFGVSCWAVYLSIRIRFSRIGINNYRMSMVKPNHFPRCYAGDIKSKKESAKHLSLNVLGVL